MGNTRKDNRRRCPFCRGYFRPNPSRPNQRFCSADHQKTFWKNGGLADAKLLEKIGREVETRFSGQSKDLATVEQVREEGRAALAEVIRLRENMERNFRRLRAELQHLGVKVTD